MAALAKLAILDLRNNRLDKVPEWLGNLSSLRHLDLRANRFREMRGSIADLPKLEKLDLRWNRITIPGALVTRLEVRGCAVLL